VKFYRRLPSIKAISFDLDDTLYSNKPVMLSIEKKMATHFAHLLVSHQHLLPSSDLLPSSVNTLNRAFWDRFRKQALLNQPELVNDVVKIRLVTYCLGLKALGFTADIATQLAQQALDYFIGLRSDFTVPNSSKVLLETLSKHYPLVAITNGNVDTKVIGINQYFTATYHAGWQADGTLLKQKPAGDMFAVACKKLAITPKQLLHVGDCGRSDIIGALQAGCATAWLSCYDVGQPISVLPHVELSDITQLQQLLC